MFLRLWLTCAMVAAMPCCHRDSEPRRVPSATAALASTPRAALSAMPTSTAAAFTLRKRKHEEIRLPVPTTPGPPPISRLVPKNPRDANSRMLFIGLDDSCFVLESAKDSQPKPAAAVRVAADCPAEFDGPAWNSCTEGRMYFYKAREECWCLPLVGTVRDRIELVPCSSPNVVAPSPKN